MYRIIHDTRVEKDLSTIPKNILRVIFKKIESLRDNPRRKGVEKLVAIEGWRLRVGKYRILYQIDDRKRIITIYRVKHCKEAYR
jgi:mRNA interferase RelE/StbE